MKEDIRKQLAESLVLEGKNDEATYLISEMGDWQMTVAALREMEKELIKSTPGLEKDEYEAAWDLIGKIRALINEEEGRHLVSVCLFRH